MCFNSLRRSFLSSRGKAFVALLTVTLFSSGCDWFGKHLKVGEDDKRAKKAVYNTSAFGCMWGVRSKIEHYMNGQLSDDEIISFGACIKDALSRFSHITNPRQGYYDPYALANFLNERFLKEEERLTPKLVGEIMELKAVLLGGDAKKFTIEEYKGLVDLVSLLEKLAIRNRPYIPIYSMKAGSGKKTKKSKGGKNKIRPNQVSPALLIKAKQELRLSGQELAAQFSRSGNIYNLESLRRLLNESEYLFEWEKSRKERFKRLLKDDGKSDIEIHEIVEKEFWTNNDMVDLLIAIKGVATSSSDLLIQPQEWLPLIDSLTGIHGIYLDWQKYVRKKKRVLMDNLDPVVTTVNNGFALVENAIATSPSKYIPFSKIDNVIDILGRKGLLKVSFKKSEDSTDKPKSNLFDDDEEEEEEDEESLKLEMRPESVKQVYQHVISVAMRNPLTATPMSRNPGLNLDALNELRSEFFTWVNSQEFLTRTAERWTEAFKLPQSRTSARLWALLRHFDFSDYLRKPKLEQRSEEMEFIIRYVRPFFASEDNRAFIVPRRELEPFGIRHNWENLTRMNNIRALVRLLIRSFADQERILKMQGVTAAEMDAFYEKAKPLGVDLKFMDPRKLGVGTRTFNEGNLFTFNGDGVPMRDLDPQTTVKEELLTYTETLELLALMWSSGQVRDRMYYRLVEACSKKDGKAPLDPLGDPKISRKCFYEELASKQFRELDNLPLMQNYLLSLRNLWRSSLFRDLEIIANVCDDWSWIENSEIATMTTVLHYVEVIFSIYDVNRSDRLEGPEIMRAFSRFSGYLGRQVEAVLGESSDISLLKAIYVFLLEKRRLPTATDGALLYFYKYRYFDDNVFQYGFSNGSAPMSFIYDKEESRPEQPEVMPAAPSVSIDRANLITVLRVLSGLNGETSTVCD